MSLPQAKQVLKTLSSILILFVLAINAIQAEVKPLSHFIINRFDHDPTLFTQGLAFHNGLIYESSGLYGKSSVLIRSLDNPRPRYQQPLPSKFFAEGLSLHNNKLYLLSWKAGVVWVYDPKNLALLEEHHYRGQGWGLCSNGSQLIMSNGSHQLQFFSAENFQKLKTLTVTEAGKPLRLLNELEWVNGKIYANIWRSHRIVIINPQNGKVEASIDLTKLYPPNMDNPDENVLNGIAYDADDQRLFVTGKRWPWLYEIKLKK